MKKLIRTIEFIDTHSKDSMKAQLNNLGFYCLSLGDKILEVYAIEHRVYFEQRVIEFLSLLVKMFTLKLLVKAAANNK